MPRPELEQLQLERLQALLVRLARNVRRYREQIADVQVKSLEDLARLPFTTPEDMAQSFPYGMFALPLRRVIRLHSTIGPGGNRLVVGHSHNDLVQWGRLVARQLVASGVTANDVVQVCLGSDTQGGASGYALGAELVEATVIAEEPSHIYVQISMLNTYRPTTLITTPTNALELARALDARKIDPQSLHLRTVLLTRPVDAAARAELASRLLVEVQSNLGIDQILDPGFCVECDAGHFHVNEDQFVVEVQDGELVVTTLSREAMPLLRYRTRLACEIVRGKCACSRTGAMLIPGGYLDGRLRVNEMPVYESQIAEALSGSPAAGHRFSFEATDRRLIVSIEITPELLSDRMSQMTDWQREIALQFLIHLGLEAEVRFVAPRQ
jgi:phenylacetate-CoA ligase